MPVPGTMGKIVMVDLSTPEISIETPSDDLYCWLAQQWRPAVYG